jgi:hypothetical protein
MKKCVLTESKICDQCGECFKCDLDPTKICDNCGACIGLDADYRAIEITEILWQQEGPGKEKPQIKPFRLSGASATDPDKAPKKVKITKKTVVEVEKEKD